MNIVVPIASKSAFFKDGLFPKILTEICGKTMLEHFVANLVCFKEANFIFILQKQEVQRYFLDESIKLLLPKSEIIVLEKESLGMACSALFSIDFIDNDEELIICNSDQIFECDLSKIVTKLKEFDAGVISFESFHPRYAFAKDEEGLIVEVAEKKPISKNAIAGFYYFKKGSDFIKACEKMIEKDSNYEGHYYIAPCLNELILQNKQIYNYKIAKNEYFTFYSPEKIKEFERLHNE